MNRQVMEREHLAHAERHIDEAKQRIGELVERIAILERDEQDTHNAKDLRRTFAGTLGRSPRYHLRELGKLSN